MTLSRALVALVVAVLWGAWGVSLCAAQGDTTPPAPASEDTTPPAPPSEDTTPPAVATTGGVAITSTPPAGQSFYKADDTITVTVSFTETVSLTGVDVFGTNHASVSLNVGGTSKTALATSPALDVTELTFTYKVQAGLSDDDGVSIDSDLTLGGTAAIKDAAGNDATLTFASVPDNAAAKVDSLSVTPSPSTTMPTSLYVVNATWLTVPANELFFVPGEVISVALNLSRDVTVTLSGGSPTVLLGVGSSNRIAQYVPSLSSPKSLVFTYTVEADPQFEESANGDAPFPPERKNRQPRQVHVVEDSLKMNGATLTLASTGALYADELLHYPEYSMAWSDTQTGSDDAADVFHVQFPGSKLLTSDLGAGRAETHLLGDFEEGTYNISLARGCLKGQEGSQVWYTINLAWEFTDETGEPVDLSTLTIGVGGKITQVIWYCAGGRREPSRLGCLSRPPSGQLCGLSPTPPNLSRLSSTAPRACVRHPRVCPRHPLVCPRHPRACPRHPTNASAAPTDRRRVRAVRRYHVHQRTRRLTDVALRVRRFERAEAWGFAGHGDPRSGKLPPSSLKWVGHA